MALRFLMVFGVALLATIAAAQDTPAFKSEKQRVSYALGINLAKQLRAQWIEVDPDVLSEALKAALSGSRTLLTDQEVHAIVVGLQKEFRARRAALRNQQSGAREELAEILVSFKLDPRLATGVYGGERWVSPPTYTRVGEGKHCIVDAKVQGLGANRTPIAITPTWTSSDSDMVTITPGEGSPVTITVKRAGAASVRVSAQGISKELAIRAAYRNDVLQVDISPK